MSLPRSIAAVLRASVARVRTSSAAALIPQLPPDALKGLANAARLHGIAGYVHRAVDDLEGVADEERRGLRHLRERAVLAHLRTLQDLRHVHQTLSRAGIPYVVIKGPTLAEPVHGAVELRSYSDLDVLVLPASLGPTMEALEAAGSTVEDRNWAMLRDELKGEVHLRLPSGTQLDLHWHLLNDKARRGTLAIDLGGLFERATTVRVGDLDVPTIAAADTAVYVAIHTIHSGGHRLLWLKDLERVLALPGLDIDEMVARARQWRAELVLATAASRAAHSVGLPPAATDLPRLGTRPRVWSLVTAAAWRLSPAERQDGSGSLGRIVARSVRDTQAASIRALARRGLHNLVSRGDDDGRDDAGRFPITDPRSGRYAGGGVEERQAFLDRVAAWDRPVTTPDHGRAPGHR